jgi:hypothetical protein
MAAQTIIDAIMFSASPVRHVHDAIDHLTRHPVVFWTVDFPIVVASDWKFPLAGYIHVAGDQVRFKATIEAILRCQPDHYDFEGLKPEAWRTRFQEHRLAGRFSLLISKIREFSYPTVNFQKLDGGKVRTPPPGYFQVRRPEVEGQTATQITLAPSPSE